MATSTSTSTSTSTVLSWLRVLPDLGDYAASKAAVVLLTDTTAVEAAEYEVSVFPVGPGMVDTVLTRDLDAADSGRRWMGPLYKNSTSVPAALAAHAAVYLASGRADTLRGDGSTRSTIWMRLCVAPPRSPKMACSNCGGPNPWTPSTMEPSARSVGRPGCRAERRSTIGTVRSSSLKRAVRQAGSRRPVRPASSLKRRASVRFGRWNRLRTTDQHVWANKKGLYLNF
ncbi:SDR family oxidoreductase [Rhodococcus sp. 14C212]|nr:SDR family oxidoreductase [Rhodococcus sp. 14C212]